MQGWVWGLDAYRNGIARNWIAVQVGNSNGLIGLILNPENTTESLP